MEETATQVKKRKQSHIDKENRGANGSKRGASKGDKEGSKVAKLVDLTGEEDDSERAERVQNMAFDALWDEYIRGNPDLDYLQDKKSEVQVKYNEILVHVQLSDFVKRYPDLEGNKLPRSCVLGAAMAWREAEEKGKSDMEEPWRHFLMQRDSVQKILAGPVRNGVAVSTFHARCALLCRVSDSLPLSISQTVLEAIS
jgi:hypothetical protein